MSLLNETRTRACWAFGHPEFLLRYDPSAVLEADVEWLAMYLEQSVARGGRYDEGTVVPLGCVPCRVVRREDGDLGLLEPDFASLPACMIEAVHATLRHLRVQREVLDSVGLIERGAWPSPDESVGICPRLEAAMDCVMTRGHGAPGESGWTVRCADGHDCGALGSPSTSTVHEAQVRFPAWMPFLALPPDASVVLRAGGGFEVLLGGEGLPLRPGSYLDLRRRRTRD